VRVSLLVALSLVAHAALAAETFDANVVAVHDGDTVTVLRNGGNMGTGWGHIGATMTTCRVVGRPRASVPRPAGGMHGESVSCRVEVGGLGRS
jgi:hypothetical protein